MVTVNGNGKYPKETNGKPCPVILEELVEQSGSATEEETKIRLIAGHIGQIMALLGLNLEDDSLKGTPTRVAKMYVQEVFSGLDPRHKPQVRLFDNNYGYTGMLIEKNITVHSTCEHHLVPIVGRAHVAYYSSGKIIGLSKINRIVQYYSRRPQVQERLTVQIADALKEALQTEDVAVVVDALHFCVVSRGVGDVNSTTVTSHFSGRFEVEDAKKEFMSILK